ncbi:Ribonuclease H [compost metagenome]
MKKDSRNNIIVFSDGACSGNPGPGGWGTVVVLPNDSVYELGGGDRSTTNNRMEMTAALEGLRFLSDHPGVIDFYTDSTYLIRGITQWIWGWRRKGWKTADGKEVLNKDIWEELAKVIQARGPDGKIEWKYSRGHIGIPGNERCDEIAVAFSKNIKVSLYRGSLESYPIDILTFPTDTALPEMKSPGEKKVAFSYLSNIGGLVYRHRDWPSCQRRVSGKSGAKFKKTTSASDEIEVLKSWGLGPQTEIKEG